MVRPKRSTSGVISPDPRSGYEPPRAGLYVDAAYVRLNGGFKSDLGRLLDFFADLGPILPSIYLGQDRRGVVRGQVVRSAFARYLDHLRHLRFTIVPVRAEFDTTVHGQVLRVNADAVMCTHIMRDALKLQLRDVILVSGDGDFAPAIALLQRDGVRVTVVGLDNVSQSLLGTADCFVDGREIPGFVRQSAPPSGQQPYFPLTA